MSFAAQLLALQGQDGGWGYGQGCSWTEPTALALLALCAGEYRDSAAVRSGAAWLRAQQHPDGGFRPCAAVGQSTWVTSVPLLLPQDIRRTFREEAAIRWLMERTGRESGLMFRLRQRISGSPDSAQYQFTGWPWTDGASAWVTPTALALLALRRSGQAAPHREAVTRRLNQGAAYLISRMCSDGGWNYGPARVLGYESSSYPETTGLALAGLYGVERNRLRRSLDLATGLLQRCKSSEAASWLQLGLAAHGVRIFRDVSPRQFDTRAIALAALASVAVSGNHPLVS